MTKPTKEVISTAMELLTKAADLLGFPCCAICYNKEDVITAFLVGDVNVAESAQDLFDVADVDIFDRPLQTDREDLNTVTIN